MVVASVLLLVAGMVLLVVGVVQPGPPTLVFASMTACGLAAVGLVAGVVRRRPRRRPTGAHARDWSDEDE